MQALRQLFAEQTSPSEVILFVFICVVGCMAVAAAAYAAIMTLIWALRLRPRQIPLSRAFLPTPEQLREHLGEYLLAVGTAALLTLTLAVKHDLVEEIRSFSELGDQGLEREIAALFPLHVVPSGIELTGVALETVLKPALDAGSSLQAKGLVESLIVERALRENHAFADSLPRILLLSCAFLTLFYLLWLARKRAAQLAAGAARSPLVEYAKTSRQLLLLAFCAALLLVQASVFEDDNLLAESALASVRSAPRTSPQGEADVTEEIRSAIEEQERALWILAPGDQSHRGASLEAQMVALRNADAQLRSRADTLDGEARQLEGRIDELQSLEERNNASIAGKLSELEANAESLAGSLGGRLEAFAERLSSHEEGLAALRAELAALGDDLRAAIEPLAECCEEVRSGLDQTRRRNDAEVAELRSDLGRVDNGLEEIGRSVADQGTEVTELRDQLRRMQAAIAESSGRAAAELEERLRSLEATLQALRRQTDATGERLADALGRIERLEGFHTRGPIE